jgi:hypothetical protein
MSYLVPYCRTCCSETRIFYKNSTYHTSTKKNTKISKACACIFARTVVASSNSNSNCFHAVCWCMNGRGSYHVVISFSLCKNNSSIYCHMRGFIHLTATLVDGENNFRGGIRKVEICKVQRFVDCTLMFCSDCLVLFISTVNRRPESRSCNCSCTSANA